MHFVLGLREPSQTNMDDKDKQVQPAAGGRRVSGGNTLINLGLVYVVTCDYSCLKVYVVEFITGFLLTLV